MYEKNKYHDKVIFSDASVCNLVGLWKKNGFRTPIN